MTGERFLIVNADDFGRSHGINRGIVRAHEEGIVTSASLMVRWPAALEAAHYAMPRPRLSVGLHLDLGEWTCLDGNWTEVYRVVSQDNAGALRQELAAQLEAFRKLMGRDPTHIDSHQHVHLKEPVRRVVIEEGARLGIPIRACSAEVQYCGRFYGQSATGWPFPEGIQADALKRICEELPEGVTELACHPSDEEEPDSMYSRERLTELATLCDRKVKSAIKDNNIRLRSFHGLATQAAGAKG